MYTLGLQIRLVIAFTIRVTSFIKKSGPTLGEGGGGGLMVYGSAVKHSPLEALEGTGFINVVGDSF